MKTPKPSRRKTSASKLEPIDWREFASDAVLNGNMSTLYRRPPTEDPSAYASPEAMVEIEKRVVRPAVEAQPTNHQIPTVRSIPTADTDLTGDLKEAPTTLGSIPTVGTEAAAETAGPTTPTVAPAPTVAPLPTVGSVPGVAVSVPTEVTKPTEGVIPTVGSRKNKKLRPIRSVQDALTLAGQVLYRAMFGSSEGLSTSCTKGYRQLAAETHLDKDTIRDLIVEFKSKGIVQETATYDPDTRLSKTYEVLSDQPVLEAWRKAGIFFVTAGRQRPIFCSAAGDPIAFIPTVGTTPSASN
jgi:hypothetical protein